MPSLVAADILVSLSCLMAGLGVLAVAKAPWELFVPIFSLSLSLFGAAKIQYEYAIKVIQNG